jgi:hypothetical protein
MNAFLGLLFGDERTRREQLGAPNNDGAGLVCL